MEGFDIGVISMAITELIKRFGVASKWASLICVVLAIAPSILNNPVNIQMAVIDGLMAGLVATGLYGVGSSIIKKTK